LRGKWREGETVYHERIEIRDSMIAGWPDFQGLTGLHAVEAAEKVRS
jgi:hypothetical protein